jgi:hypothetical protein
MSGIEKPVNHFKIIYYLILILITLILLDFHLILNPTSLDKTIDVSRLIEIIISIITTICITLGLIDYSNDRSHYIERINFLKICMMRLKITKKNYEIYLQK